MAENNFTDDNFEKEVLQSEVPVFVDFWAPWCGPCQMMGPIVDELSTEFEVTKIKLGKLNVDESKQVAGKFEVLSIPTFKIFKSGKVVDTIVGGVTKEKLKGFIEKSL
jgi:thioredoxin 1